ncbi:HNH endonuclease [Salarchaeum sp. JOR-1]|nr:HNH endonuclease [Salarchaeum sp. JOR-1]
MTISLGSCSVHGVSDLRTEQGVRQHHTKVHGDPLPNRTCADCEREFYDPKSRRTYCDDCYSEGGEKNGNYRNAKESATCESCSDAFGYYPSEKKGVYCPDCVEESDDFLGTPYADIVDAKRVTRSCAHCESDISVLESTRRQGQGRFCSNDCLYAWVRKDGDEPAYNGGWREAKRKALERDDHTCQKCGSDAEDLGQEPDIHHSKPLRTYDDPEQAHQLENLVALCKRCHMRVEHASATLPRRAKRSSRNAY